MAAIVSLEGRETMIHEFLDANTVTVRLSSATPNTLDAYTTVITDFTELDVDGYVAQDITAGAGWEITTDAGTGVTTYSPALNDGVVTFNPSVQFDAYQYYVTYHDGTDDVLLWAEDLDPTLPASNVQTIDITIRLRVRNPV